MKFSVCSISSLKKIILIFAFFISTGLLFAQTKFVQKLEWKGDTNVLEYKVEIQNKAGQIISSVITEEYQVELSLVPGSYKYKITAYDLLGRQAQTTSWIPFEIFKANQPAIVHNQNLEALEEDGSTLILSVNIMDVTSGTKAELISSDNKTIIQGSLVLASGQVWTGSGGGSEIQTAVAAKFTNVTEGNWKLLITNPSGLYSESLPFEVKNVVKEERLAAAKAEEERIAREKAEAERLAKEEAERLEREEAERLAREEEERLAKEEEERLAREEAERLAKEEAERLAREEAERLAKEEAERLIKEEAARQEAERLAREEAEREEAEQLAQKEAERLAKEAVEAEAAEATESEESEDEVEEKTKKVRPDWDRKFFLAGGAGLNFIVKDEDLFTQYFTSNMNLDINAKLAFLPVHNAKSRFGLEISGNYTKFDENNEYYDIIINSLITQASLVYRHNLAASKNCIQLKGGGGLVFLQKDLDFYATDENTSGKSSQQIFAYPEAGVGFSLMLMMGRTFALEVGVNANALFIQDAFTVTALPFASLGIRF